MTPRIGGSAILDSFNLRRARFEVFANCNLCHCARRFSLFFFLFFLSMTSMRVCVTREALGFALRAIS